jgi:hypothetical protein
MMQTSSADLRRRRWHQARVVMTSFVVASIAALLVPRAVPERAVDLVLVIVIWIVFYPVARLKTSEPWWAHWMRGVIILMGFWVATKFLR